MIFKRQIGEKGQVVIPKDVREMLGLKKGNTVSFEIKDNEIKITNDSSKDVLDKFFSSTLKNVDIKEIKRLEEESYDLP